MRYVGQEQDRQEGALISGDFAFFYQSEKEAKAISAALSVDNCEFNKAAGRSLVETRVEGKMLKIKVSGKSVPSFRATVDDIITALQGAERTLENVDLAE